MVPCSQFADSGSASDSCGGASIAKDIRVVMSGIVDNAAECSAAEAAAMFALPVDRVRRILAFARAAP